jgi:hypothetical protein
MKISNCYDTSWLIACRSRVLECQYPPGGNGNRIAGLGIAALAVGLMLHLKPAEAGEFQALPLFKRLLHDAENSFKHIGGFFIGASGCGLNFFCKVCFGY